MTTILEEHHAVGEAARLFVPAVDGVAAPDFELVAGEAGGFFARPEEHAGSVWVEVF